jgi:tRNA nucleotidyltransferase (CCA-adding enzyme)
VGSVGVIKSNPDQSKHLETATLRVMGFELDFVNLRAEEYTDTRIPMMRIGTALEDAMRRDLTINALFYNLNRRTVEDFTGQGIQAHILKT